MSNVDDVAHEFLELADLLEAAPLSLWDAPSLCAGWHTRQVVAHMTMPARLTDSEFFAELQAVGGDFNQLSNMVALRDGARSPTELLADLRSPALHAWEPPVGGRAGALVHVVIHALDITEATGLDRQVPNENIAGVLAVVGDGDLFGVDFDGVELRATDLGWSRGSGQLVSGPGQILALIACGRRVPASRLGGEGAARFTL